MVRCLVVGHDLVAGLRDVCGKITHVPIHFGLEGDEVGFLAEPGGTIRDTWDSLDTIVQAEPDIIFLDVGSVDLYENSCAEVAEAVLGLAEELLSATTSKYVYVGTFIFRFRGHDRLNTEEEENAYNQKVNGVNIKLMELSSGFKYIRYRFMRGIRNPHHPFLESDGFTLNESGLIKYYRHVRGALVDGRKKLLAWEEMKKIGECELQKPTPWTKGKSLPNSNFKITNIPPMVDCVSGAKPTVPPEKTQDLADETSELPQKIPTIGVVSTVTSNNTFTTGRTFVNPSRSSVKVTKPKLADKTPTTGVPPKAQFKGPYVPGPERSWPKVAKQKLSVKRTFTGQKICTERPTRLVVKREITNMNNVLGGAESDTSKTTATLMCTIPVLKSSR